MKEEARVLEIDYWQEYDAFTKGSTLNTRLNKDVPEPTWRPT